MRIAGSVALVSGANRGLGRAYVEALLAAGAAKVYAAARDPRLVTVDDAIAVALDITDPAAVAAAARTCADVTLLINNAGIVRSSPFVTAPSMDAARAEMETNYFGTLAMCRAFAQVLGGNGGGAVVNMLSVVSWFTYPFSASQCASKAAQWSLTNGIRIELRAQGTLVVGVHAGFIDTDMAAGLDVPKTSPHDIARRVLEGIEAGREEILADQRSTDVKAALARDPAAFYAQMQQLWDAAQPARHP
ncbi:MAG TPA: SDR family oxidoreductase [Vineibacter sp.]|nr:SDR family oxidoreductase [Vineibacter sp.]